MNKLRSKWTRTRPRGSQSTRHTVDSSHSQIVTQLTRHIVNASQSTRHRNDKKIIKHSQNFKHGFLISKHLRARRHGILAPARNHSSACVYNRMSKYNNNNNNNNNN